MNTKVMDLIVAECKVRDFRPSRVVKTDQGGLIMSWMSPGKYAEIEFYADGTVKAAVSFETGTPTFILVTSQNQTEQTDVALKYRVSKVIVRLQDFME